MLSKEVEKALNWCSRAKLQDILERHGFAVYDSETTEELREAVKVNIEDGTIAEDALDE